MYYGPDGKLRAVEARALYKSTNAPPGTGAPGFSRSFEEYRYDALGRRVATRFDQECDYYFGFNLHNAPCHVSGIRRTVWDGSQELGEIQLPAEQLENDYYVGQGTVTPSSINLAPFYGAVAYAYDGKIDQPLAIKRLRYSNLTPSNTIVELAAFTYYPVWDVHRMVPTVVGNGSLPAPVCPDDMAGGTKATCLTLILQPKWLPYRDMSVLWARAWQGTLLEDKAGAGGLMYRRNRYYDSKSGRFTQEDPIGLAGGLNVYGFASGDPVNFSDPFGLGPCQNYPEGQCPEWLAAAERAGDALNSVLLGLAGVVSAVGSFFGAADLWKAGSGIDENGQQMSTGSRLTAAALGLASMYPGGRALGVGELGVKGVSRVEGFFGVAGGKAIAHIDYIEGRGANPFSVINRLKEMARAGGAKTLRIQGRVANEELYNVLRRRYNLQSLGGLDVIEIKLR